MTVVTTVIITVAGFTYRNLARVDRLAGGHFNALLQRYNMKGRYWYEHYNYK